MKKTIPNTTLHTRQRPKRWAVFIIVVFVLSLGLTIAALVLSRDPQTPAKNSPNTVDLSPASNEEKQDSNRLKEESTKSSAELVTQSVKTVTPTIVDVSQYEQIEARAFVAGIVEDTGTCTYRFTMGQSSVVRTVKASADATTTRCDNLNLESQVFAEQGAWTLIVAYSSPTAMGSSQPKTFKVQR